MSGNQIEIPMQPGNRVFTAELAGKPYLIRQMWNAAQGGCYVIDIGDATTRQIMVPGIPLITGVDLLEQYDYMEFGGKLIVTTDRGAGEIPTFDGLGATSHLYFIPD